MWIYNMFPRWISYLSIIQTKNINETNKAFKNGTEAKMCVNTRWLWWKQGREESNLLASVYYCSTEWNSSTTTALLTPPLATHSKIQVSVTIQIEYQNPALLSDGKGACATHKGHRLFYTLLIHGTQMHNWRPARRPPAAVSVPAALRVGLGPFLVTQTSPHNISVLCPQGQQVLTNQEGHCFATANSDPWRGEKKAQITASQTAGLSATSGAIARNWMEKAHSPHGSSKDKGYSSFVLPSRQIITAIRELLTEDTTGNKAQVLSKPTLLTSGATASSFKGFSWWCSEMHRQSSRNRCNQCGLRLIVHCVTEAGISGVLDCFPQHWFICWNWRELVRAQFSAGTGEHHLNQAPFLPWGGSARSSSELLVSITFNCFQWNQEAAFPLFQSFPKFLDY